MHTETPASPSLTVVVGGTFQAPLFLKAVLGRYPVTLITSTPPFRWERAIRQGTSIRFIPKPSQIVERLFALRSPHLLKEHETRLFGMLSSLQSRAPSLLYAWAGDALESAQGQKNRGGIFVLDRACPHIDLQEQIAEKECATYQVRYDKPSRSWFDRCRAEYTIADRIVVPSTFTLNSFIARGIARDKLVLIPLIGKLNIPDPASLWHRNDGVFRVCFPGGNLLRKGLIYLLQAWKILHLPDAELVIKASPQELMRYPVLARLMRSLPNVTTAGYYDNVADFYRASDVFCLPSVDEGFGMTALEAMSCGLPVIVSGNVGASDLIADGEAGFITPPRDPLAIAAAIERLYQDRDLRLSMGRKAHDTVTQRCNPRSYQEQILDFLNGLYS